MDYSLIDYFRAFHTYSKKYELPANTRSAYCALLGEFNAGFWPDELCLSDRALQALAGVKSLSTIHDAKNTLKQIGLISYRPWKNRKTIYKLCTEHLANTWRTPAEHLPNTAGTLGASSNIRTREDLKTLDLKTLDLSTTTTSTRVRDFQELDDILEYWERDLRGGRLSFEHQSQIAAWLDQHGVEWVKGLMKEASDANSTGLNFKFLRAVLERREKGGVKRERVNKPSDRIALLGYDPEGDSGEESSEVRARNAALVEDVRRIIRERAEARAQA